MTAVLLLFSRTALAQEECPPEPIVEDGMALLLRMAWRMADRPLPLDALPQPSAAANFSAYYYNSRGGIGRGHRTTAYSTEAAR